MGRMVLADTDVSLLRYLADSIPGSKSSNPWPSSPWNSNDSLIIHAIDVGLSIESPEFDLLPIV